MENKWQETGFLWHFMDMIYIENDVVTVYKHTQRTERGSLCAPNVVWYRYRCSGRPMNRNK